MAERFLTFWPVEARLVHIRDRQNAEDPWRSLCTVRWRMGDVADDYDVPAGEEYLICATCTKILARREGKT